MHRVIEPECLRLIILDHRVMLTTNVYVTIHVYVHIVSPQGHVPKINQISEYLIKFNFNIYVKSIFGLIL